jgi:hypothetical protein
LSDIFLESDGILKSNLLSKIMAFEEILKIEEDVSS